MSSRYLLSGSRLKIRALPQGKNASPYYLLENLIEKLTATSQEKKERKNCKDTGKLGIVVFQPTSAINMDIISQQYPNSGMRSEFQFMNPFELNELRLHLHFL